MKKTSTRRPGAFLKADFLRKVAPTIVACHATTAPPEDQGLSQQAPQWYISATRKPSEQSSCTLARACTEHFQPQDRAFVQRA